MTENGMEAMGAQLREVRKRRGITQELLAEATGLSDDTIQRAEKGDIHPKSLAKILRVLGLKMTINLEPSK